jgi:hypothetical protein
LCAVYKNNHFVETWLFLYKIWSHVDEMVILNLSTYFLYKNNHVSFIM